MTEKAYSTEGASRSTASTGAGVEALLSQEGQVGQMAWVRGLARRLLADDDAADDVVQETWLAALEEAARHPGRRAGRGPDGWRAWFAAVVRNLSSRRRRRDAQRREVEGRAARTETVPDRADDVDRLEVHRALVEAVAELEAPYRAVIVARYFEGLSHAEIAERLEVSPAAVRQRATRAVRILRARLDERGGDAAWRPGLVGLLAREGGCFPDPAGRELEGWIVRGVARLLERVFESKLLVGSIALAGVLLVSATIRGDGETEPGGLVYEPSVAPSVAAPAPSVERGASPRALPMAEADAAQAAPAPGEAVESLARARARIRGSVRDTGGRPLAGAWIRREDPTRGDAELFRTDEEGSFDGAHWRVASGQSLSLRVGCDGYVDQRILAVAGEPFTVHLAALPRVSGRVVDERGDALPGPGYVQLRWSAIGEEAGGGGDGPTDPDELAIDAQGAFSSGPLPVGTLTRANVLARGFPEMEVELDRALAPDGRVELELTVPSGVVVTGTVVDDVTRAPVGGASVWADTWQFEADSLRPTAFTDADGRFELRGVDPGEHATEDGRPLVVVWVMARAPGYTATPTRALAAMANDEGRYDFEVSLVRATCALRGRVADSVGEPIALAHVHGIDSQGNHHFALSNAQGAFDWEGLPEGELTVLARRGTLGEDGNGCATIATRLELGVDARLTLEVDPGSGRVEGLVLDAAGAPVEGVAVEAAQHFVAGAMAIGLDSAGVRTDAEGRYVFERMPPGRFDITIAEDRADCARPASHGMDLGVGEERAGVDFAVHGCAVFAGAVFGGGELPLASLRVVLVDLSSGHEIASERLEADGTFHFEPTARGIYEARLLRDGTPLGRLEVGPEGDEGLVLAVD